MPIQITFPIPRRVPRRATNLAFTTIFGVALLLSGFVRTPYARADSLSPTSFILDMQVDRNRCVGDGAGNISYATPDLVCSNNASFTLTSGAGHDLTFTVRPGFQFDPASPVSAKSSTFGINGGAPNVAALVTPTGAANETLTFTLTSGGTGSDKINFSGIRLLIASPDIATAGVHFATMSYDSTAAGGGYQDYQILRASIIPGAAYRLDFVTQPTDSPAGADLLPQVKIVDFGGNVPPGAGSRNITLAIQNNPGNGALTGTTQVATSNGTATWTGASNLAITKSGIGYTLRASHSGPTFLSSDTVDSDAFNITSAPLDHLEFSTQPTDTPAGSDILASVSAVDVFGNTVTSSPVSVTLDLGANPAGGTLLSGTSLTKNTVNGVATWSAVDDLHINVTGTGYKLRANGAGPPSNSNSFDIIAPTADYLKFSTQPINTSAGADILVTVTALDVFENVVTSSPISVTLDIDANPAGASLLSSTSLTKNTLNGVVSWSAADDLRINVAANGYTLFASGVGVPVSSDPFAITAAAADALRFVQQPTDTIAGNEMTPSLSVEMIDAFGNRTADVLAVALSLNPAPCGGTIFGGNTNSLNGLAVFSNLTINTPCNDNGIRATSPGLTPADSNLFVIFSATNLVINGVGIASDDDPTSVMITYTIQGTTAAPPFEIKIGLDKGPAPDGIEDLHLLTLAPGDASVDLTPGSHIAMCNVGSALSGHVGDNDKIIVGLDSAADVTETSETDNIKSSSALSVDLHAVSLEYDADNTSATFHYSVNAPTNVPAYNIQFFLDTSAPVGELDAGDISIALVAGNTSPGDHEIQQDLSENPLAPNAAILAVVDVENTVNESTESNNQTAAVNDGSAPGGETPPGNFDPLGWLFSLCGIGSATMLPLMLLSLVGMRLFFRRSSRR